MIALIAEKLSQVVITFLITSKLLSKAFIFLSVYQLFKHITLYYSFG